MRSKNLVSYTIPNPGNFGINTQDSPLTLPEGFATSASNCVIDKKGRIASRLGREYVTTSGGTSSVIEQIFEAEWADGTTTVFSVGNSKIYSGTTTLTDITGAAVITDDDWQIAQLQDVVYFFQAGHAPLQYDKAVGSLDEVTAHGSYVATVQQGSTCLSAFGRLWTALDDTIYWSDLLNGVNWGGGTSGSIDLSTVITGDVDSVVGLAAHNNFLIIFMQRHIIIYEGATSPSTMKVTDVVNNIGAVSRDAICNIGSDVIFLDRSGMRSLGRTIQEKSAPLGRISRNVNDDILNLIADETSTIKAYYSRKYRFIILSFPSSSTHYIFDTQFPLEDGSFRTTTWDGITQYCAFELANGSLYFGSTDGIMEYSDAYTDEGIGYDMAMYTPFSQIGQPYMLKIGKELDVVTEGGSDSSFSVKWAYDYNDTYKTASVSLAAVTSAEFGVGEFAVAEFGAYSGTDINHIKITGSGRDISIGMESTINGGSLSLQEIDIHMIIGRVR